MVNGDDDVSDETTQIAKNRDNVLLHLIWHHTAPHHFLFAHSFVHTQGGWNPLYAYRKCYQPLHKIQWVKRGSMHHRSFGSFRILCVIFISLQSIGNYASEILHLGLHTHKTHCNLAAGWVSVDWSREQERCTHTHIRKYKRALAHTHKGFATVKVGKKRSSIAATGNSWVCAMCVCDLYA